MSEILEIPITDLTNPHWCRPAPEAASIIGDVTASPLIVPRIEPGTDSNLLEFERGEIQGRDEWEFLIQELVKISRSEFYSQII